MSDYSMWIPHELTEPERLAALRWALGLEATDSTYDDLLRVALATSARLAPGASEYEQRYRALVAVYDWMRQEELRQ